MDLIFFDSFDAFGLQGPICFFFLLADAKSKPDIDTLTHYTHSCNVKAPRVQVKNGLIMTVLPATLKVIKPNIGITKHDKCYRLSL